MGKCGYELWVRLKFFFSDSQEFTNVNGLASVAIDNTEQTLRCDAIVFSWVVDLALVCFHLLLQVSQFLLRGLPVRIFPGVPARVRDAPSELAEKFFHSICAIE